MFGEDKEPGKGQHEMTLLESRDVEAENQVNKGKVVAGKHSNPSKQSKISKTSGKKTP